MKRHIIVGIVIGGLLALSMVSLAEAKKPTPTPPYPLSDMPTPTLTNWPHNTVTFTPWE